MQAVSLCDAPPGFRWGRAGPELESDATTVLTLLDENGSIHIRTIVEALGHDRGTRATGYLLSEGELAAGTPRGVYVASRARTGRAGRA